MQWFFIFFFVSGFCSILYEIVWLRLAMAQFGVTSAVVSIIISMFMLGLGLGSWGAGRLIHQYQSRRHVPVLRIYAVTELLIGLSALMVPYQLILGRKLLEQVNNLSSIEYYLASGIWIGMTLIPWCVCMGATIPLGMLVTRSFSFLYLANVLGAVAGSILPLFLIELFGFHNTLYVGAGLNFLLFGFAYYLSFSQGWITIPPVGNQKAPVRNAGDKNSLLPLFYSGLASMGLEIVWIRQYTPYLGTIVYAFASILGVYLAATYAGSQCYRRMQHKVLPNEKHLWLLLALAGVLPLMTTDPRFPLSDYLRLVIGIAPFSTILGFVTPMLVDRWSQGNSSKAGFAYAVNVFGCILGPLVAGFLLLPIFSERIVTMLFTLPWLFLAVFTSRYQSKPQNLRLMTQTCVTILLLFTIIAGARSYENKFQQYELRRDSSATVIAVGRERGKQLLINGVGMTTLVPVTKMMAHLPLAFLNHKPEKALVVCFGMGTTFRSLLSWNIDVTAVELVPSVPKFFSYYHSDASRLLQLPRAHVVIDDGRRYLERTSNQYDVITIDPPPPIEAAASSLLYSKEFYATIKKRLKPDGILQQWLPGGDKESVSAVARALYESFSYVRVFASIDKATDGMHFLASQQPLPYLTAAALSEHLSIQAAADLVEWGPASTSYAQFDRLLTRERSLGRLLALSPNTPALQDDRPINEYYLLRRFGNA